MARKHVRCGGSLTFTLKGYRVVTGNLIKIFENTKKISGFKGPPPPPSPKKSLLKMAFSNTRQTQVICTNLYQFHSSESFVYFQTKYHRIRNLHSHCYSGECPGGLLGIALPLLFHNFKPMTNKNRINNNNNNNNNNGLLTEYPPGGASPVKNENT